MTRWAARVEYLGTDFRGWQTKRDLKRIQAALEEALSKVADHPVKTTAAGRTDAGVHALGQVVHFDSGAARSSYAWLLGTNTHLPAQISLRWIQPVTAGFDARRSALQRRYRYVVHNHRARSALLADRAAWIPRELDEQAMHRAAQALVGEHDFSTFRAAECQSNTPMREVREIRVTRIGEFVVLDICANAFLHHMVRNIMGALIDVGQQRQAESWIPELLAARDRRQAGVTAPAGGLYFVYPEYPPEFALPAPEALWFPASGESKAIDPP